MEKWKHDLIVFALWLFDLFLFDIYPKHRLWLAAHVVLLVCAVVIALINRARIRTLASDGVVWRKQFVDREAFWYVARDEHWSAYVFPEGLPSREMLQTRHYNSIGLLTQVATRDDEYSKAKITSFKRGAAADA